MTADPAHDAYRRGLDQLGMNQLDPAMTSFGLAIELDPDFAEAYAARAIVCMRQGMYLQAISDFTHAVKGNPALPDLFMHLSAAHEGLGDNIKALENLNLAIANDPSNPELFLKRAQMHLNANILESAVADYTSAIDALRAEFKRKEQSATGANIEGTKRLYAWREAEILSLRASCWLQIDEWVKAVADWDAILKAAEHYPGDREMIKFAVEAANNIINALNDFGAAETHVDPELAAYAKAATDLLNSLE